MLWNPAMAPEIPSTVLALELDLTCSSSPTLQGGLVVTVVLGGDGLE